jgi:hypothetical protein
MASIHHWVGSTSNVFTLAGNWDNATAPATGDTLIYDDRAVTNACTSACDAGSNGHTYARVVVSEGYNKQLADTGDELDPTAITRLEWHNSFAGTSYIKGAITDGVVRAPTGEAGVLDLGGTINRLAVEAGRVNFNTNATIDNGQGKQLALSQIGSVPTIVTIANGCTTTSAVITIGGGTLITAEDLDTVYITAGKLVLKDTAKLKNAYAGGDAEIILDSTGTMCDAGDWVLQDNAHVHCGIYTRQRTFTDNAGECHMYGNSRLNFRAQGGELLTISGQIFCHGENSPLFPRGGIVTVS